MKKILFILTVLFISTSNVFALESFHLGEKLENSKIARFNEITNHTGVLYKLLNSKNEFVYCVDSFEPKVYSSYYDEYNYNNPQFNLTDEKLDRINLIAYYGYGYQNHASNNWYVATQFLIWKNTNVTDLYFVDYNTGIKTDLYSYEINEIETLVNSYYTLPSFNNKTLEYKVGTTYIEDDLNNVLSNYEIVESNIEAKIEGNKLVIDPKGSGEYEIKFKRSLPISKGYTLYRKDGYQSLISPGKVKDIEFTLNIKVEDNIQIVEVPDTGKIDYILFLPFILIFIGIINIIIYKKNTTH